MHIDRLLVLVQGFIVAQELEQLRAGVDTTRTARQMAQDLELGRSKADPALATLNASSLEVDEQVMVADYPAARGVGQIAIRPSQQRLDPAHELAQPEGLRQVVVGSQLQADHLVDLVAARRQHQDRSLGAGRAQAPEHLEAIDAGQPDVEDH